MSKLKQNSSIDTQPMLKELQELKRELNNVQSKKEENLQLELNNKIPLNAKNGVFEFKGKRTQRKSDKDRK
ncbi:hypothetical protein [Halalkalibacter urbisdiaboli]|uniref:hypothetical protein n=1 Tax=Halalkalibacter urbisdiaboli TaxID=1960589 RepID=UPI000B44FB6E|nr:hypothetical protein [Halalkalibacter urbisdiaboli]